MIVAHELLVGAANDKREKALRRGSSTFPDETEDSRADPADLGIVTENSADFGMIASVLDIRFTRPESIFDTTPGG